MPKSSSTLILEINEPQNTPYFAADGKKRSHADKEIWEKKRAILLMSCSLGLLLTVIRGLGILILAHRSHKIRQ